MNGTVRNEMTYVWYEMQVVINGGKRKRFILITKKEQRFIQYKMKF
jgi:hypothetical protein